MKKIKPENLFKSFYLFTPRLQVSFLIGNFSQFKARY
jgi:hypothetical protein